VAGMACRRRGGKKQSHGD